MKILVTPTSFKKIQNNNARAVLEDFADEITYNPFRRPLVSSEVKELIKDCDGYIAGLDYIDKKALASANKLKVISRYGTGVDRVDMTMAKKKDIKVTNTPGTNSTAVCELALALMFSLARSIPQLNTKVKNGEWPRNNGVELCNKNLAILGLGVIGKKLAVIAKSIGMKIYAYDPYIDKEFAQYNGIHDCTLEKAISEADFVSLHMPLMEETRHCINENTINSMKDGTMIINTARGGLIDEEAAYKALTVGKLGGLALDTHETEPVADSPFKDLDNVILTPHTGAHTNEAIQAMGMMAVENLIDVLSNTTCEHVVTC